LTRGTINSSLNNRAVALSFNGGKENIILIHLTRYVLKNNHKNILLFNFEEFTFKEIEDFVESSCKTFKFELLRIKEDGFKACFFKLLELHPEIDHVLMGVRRTDPYCEKSDYFEPTTSGWPKCIRVNPLLDWSYQDVWNFIIGLEI
jgi:FAD synthetase